MIIGNGALATSLKKSKKLMCSQNIYIAAGVSNSQETRYSEFQRERDFIENLCRSYKSNRIIYFSTFYLNSEELCTSMYARHKLEVEKYIQENASGSVIIRIPNLVTCDMSKRNRNSLLPYLFDEINKGNKVNIFEGADRYIIHAQDLTEALELGESEDFCRLASSTLYDFYLDRKISALDIYKVMVNELQVCSSNFKLLPGGVAHKKVNTKFPYAKHSYNNYNESAIKRFFSS